MELSHYILMAQIGLQFNYMAYKITKKIESKLGMTEDEIILSIAQSFGFQSGDAKQFLDDKIARDFIFPKIIEIAKQKKEKETSEIIFTINENIV